MNSTENRGKNINEQDILDSELKIMDTYKKNSGKIKPFRMLLEFYKGYYGSLILSVFFYLVKSTPAWAVPLITSDVINIATNPPADSSRRLIFDFVLAAVLILQNIPMHMLYVKFYSKSVRSVEAGLRGAMIRKLQQLSITFHKEMQSGKIQSKIMRDVETVSDLSTQILNTILGVAVNMTISLIIILNKNITVFFVFLLCIPAAAITNRIFRKKIRKESHFFRKEIENTASAVYDMEQLIPVTRAHALENNEIEKLTHDVTGIAKQGLRFDRVQSLFGSMTWASMLFFQTACLFFSAYLAMHGKITIGEIALYQSYFGSLTSYVSSILGLLPIISRGTESIVSISEILSAYDVEKNEGKEKLTSLSGAYEFKDVSFQYDERTPVLSGLNLKINAGETIALVGESGSGKSTIINLVIGFMKAQTGTVTVDGKDISQLDLRSYRQMISVVPQNSILFSGTIRQNITYGRSQITEQQLKEVVRASQLESVLEKLPDGIDTQVGESGAKLSGGQRQRISIARAIIRNPRVIIFDEATSALDSVTEHEIQLAIDHLTQNRTTFIVAHRLSTIKNADKIAVIRDGKCVEFGTYDELLQKKGEFYQYKEAQT